MKIKPIPFNTPMVQAIQAGTKTVTRRTMKPQLIMDADGMWRWKDCQWMDGGLGFPCSGIEDYTAHHPGDVLWVRETFFREECTPDCAGQQDPDECPFNRVGDYCYGYKTQYIDSTGEIKWRPSIHMPKEAARLFLRVTDVRVERLQDCGNAQAKDEGCTCCSQFARLWDATIKPSDRDIYGWNANPWVWVIEFERCEKPTGWPQEDGEVHHGD